MKKYTENYLKYFGYDVSDTILCEWCGAIAVDLNHIHPRSTHKHLENEVSNLMAMCRECHIAFADRKQFKQQLIDRHKEVMNENKH